MSWPGIIGQILAVRLLRQAVQIGRVSHAYLFVGPEGVGKRTVAVELAKAINCRAPLPGGDPCDQCSSCRKLMVDPLVHPDVPVVTPEGRFIKTDQIRALQAEMYARPTEGHKRVAIIDGAERMNAESANRLLKLLEEPPPHAALVLLTSNLSGVLPTLISRCQVIHFSPLAPDHVARALIERHSIEAGQAQVFAALAGGSLGRAVCMAQDSAVAERRTQTSDLLQEIHGMDDFAALGFAETLEKEKEQIDPWLDLLTVWLRDALLLAQTGSHQLLINTDRLVVVRELADQFGTARLLVMLAVVAETRGHLQRNVNVRLALDLLLLRLGESARSA